MVWAGAAVLAALLFAVVGAFVYSSSALTPATSRVGTLRIASEPNGATVFVDGQAVGQTPYTLATRDQPSRHTLLLQLTGHQDWSETVTVEPGDERHVLATLDVQPGALAVTSLPAGATVQLSSGQAGRTPFLLEQVPPGLYTIEVALDGHRTERQEVRVEAGQRLDHAVTLQSLPAVLNVVVSGDPAGLSLFVDGTQRGGLPARLLDLAPGKHQLRVERDGTPVWESEVDLPAGGERQVEAQPAEPAPIASSWPDALKPGERAHPVAVIVENQEDSRPQSGLHAAAVVYEALAEGGISRFLAVYMKGESQAVGPVRSARHYFVNLAKEFGAPIVHIGASPQGFAALKDLGVPSLDEAKGDGGFWRSSKRLAPHNAYVSTASVRDGLAAAAAGQEPGTFGGWLFKERPEPSRQGEDAQAVRINYGWDYRVAYEYDAESNSYRRFMAGAPHVDAETGEQLTAANVVVLTVPARVIDNVGRLDMDQVGEGRARVFLDGRVIEGSWSKASLWEPTQVLDATGARIPLNQGPTWVQIVPTTGTVSYE